MTLTPAIGDVLDTALWSHASRAAVRDAHGSWTYRDLAVWVERMAVGLRLRGVRPGDRVVAVLPDSRAAVALLYATLRVGAVFVPIEQDTSGYRLRWLLSDCTPQLVVTESKQAVAMCEPRCVRVSTPSELAAAEPTPHPVSRERGDIALMIYTSGTTAHPKAVVCPGTTVAFAASAIAQRLGYRSTDVVMSRLPLSFDYGLYQVLLCALAGAELVLAPKGREATLLSDIAAAGATVVPLVPTLAGILSQLGARRPVANRVRLVTNTGAALSGPLVARLRRVLPGAAVVFMYGMTECKRISISDPDDDAHFPGTVGVAIPGTRLMVVDSDDRPLPPGEVGQIVAAGPHVMAGYWQSSQATRERFRSEPGDGGPALFTGDYGWLDQSGRLTFVGRRDEIFKRRGLRTSIPEVEASLLDIPGVEFAAVALTDDDQLVAWVVGDLPERAVAAGVVERLGTAKAPDRVIMLPELPRTGNGKVDKAALRDSLTGQAR